jgi:Cu/Ag efflux pump CusA
VRAQVAVKAFGHDLVALRAAAARAHQALAGVDGVVDLFLEPQVDVPHVLVRVQRREAARYGLKAEEVTRTLEIALRGRKVSQVLEGGRAFDLVTWYDEKARNDVDVIRSTWLDTPSGARVTLGEVAEVVETSGPSTIQREHVQRRLAVTCNVRGDDPGAVVERIRDALDAIRPELAPGVTLELGGQLDAQRGAMQRLFLVALASGAGTLVLLVRALGSWRASFQCLANVPLAAAGGILALRLAGGTLSLASLVGFVTLTGIVVRNGILMLSHYAQLGVRSDVPLEEVVVRGTTERLVPVLMTALTAALGLVPLALAADEPGTELLRPLAIVVIGGLVSSTLLDQLVTPALFFRFSGRRTLARPVPVPA